MADMLACDWGDKGGAWWECWKVEPCCGEPCNIMDCLYCCLCWWCCPCCTWGKHFASSNDKDCACVDHCLLPWLLNFIPYLGGLIFIFVCGTISRGNTRTKVGVFEPGLQIGDCLMMIPWLCGCCCDMCQQCRSEPKEDWDWLKQCTGEVGFKCIGDFDYVRKA